MLRTQALSLPDGHGLASEARTTSLTYRMPDEAPHMLRTCEDTDPTCARDRLPVPRVVMRRP
jgi:hypothetical protein